jgi:hypothetical protein
MVYRYLSRFRYRGCIQESLSAVQAGEEMLVEHREIIGFVKSFNLVALFVLGSLSFWLMEDRFTAGLILGGLLSIFNFGIFERSLSDSFSPQEGRRFRKSIAIAKFYFRLLFLGAAIYLLLKQSWIHPVGLILGLSIVVISIIGLGIRLIFKIYLPEAT